MTILENDALQARREPTGDPPRATAPEEMPTRAGRARLQGVVARGGPVLAAVAGIGALVVVWAWASTYSRELPSPATTFGTLWDLVSSPFYDNGPNDKGVGLQLLASLQRVFLGFGMAAAVGIPFGLLLGASKWAWRAANPVVQLLRPVSPLAWFPIWLVILKDAPRAAVWVIFLTALWPIVLNTAAGAGAVPRDHRNVARVFQFGRWAYVRHVLVPDSMPAILTGLRQSMGVAWIVIVAVEMLSVSSGIGAFVWQQYNALNLAKVISAIILIGAVGLTLDAIFLRLGRAFAIGGTAE
ncbi:MAG: nitrate ABC transporter permease [Acidimicrobiales bacterium]